MNFVYTGNFFHVLIRCWHIAKETVNHIQNLKEADDEAQCESQTQEMHKALHDIKHSRAQGHVAKAT